MGRRRLLNRDNGYKKKKKTKYEIKRPSLVGDSVPQTRGTNNDDKRLVDDRFVDCYALWREIRPCPPDTSPF